MKIGVLALQGDFALHAKALSRCARSASRGASSGEASGEMVRSASRGASSGEASGEMVVEAVEVRKPEALADVDGLIMPGGESTTLLKLMDAWDFVPAIEKFHGQGKPIFGTCAGLILLAREVDNPRQPSLGLIDVDVERNAYGRQRESFEARGEVELDDTVPLEMVFIRAPRIRRTGPGVKILARHRGETVLASEGTVLVATFHPELTDDPTVHRFFSVMVEHASKRRGQLTSP